jgi:SNF2 family DNA or RNA helicase
MAHLEPSVSSIDFLWKTTLTSLASYELERYHVVLTTYDVLASEYAAFQDPTGEIKASKSKSKEAATPTADSSDSDGFGGGLKARRDALMKANAKPKKAKEKASPLFDVNWLRVVVGEHNLPSRYSQSLCAIDEAQNIKNRTAKRSLAASALESKHRWALSTS